MVRSIISSEDRNIIDLLRGASILRVVLVHLGLSWFYMPYSSYVGLFLPILFFVSGLVTFDSWQRRSSAIDFLINRMISISLPYYLLIIIILFGCILYSVDLTSNILLSWLLVNPNYSSLPFSLGQIWFLQALLVQTLLVVLALYYFKPFTVCISFLGVGLTLSVLNTTINIRASLILLSNIDIYLSLSYMVFFVFGYIYYTKISLWNRKYRILLAASLFLIFAVLVLTDSSKELGENMRQVDLLYVSGSLGFILLIMEFRYAFGRFIRFMHLGFLFNFCSKNAFSIYLLHTIVLGFVEKWFFPEPLTGNYIGAVARLIIVVCISLLISPVYTSFHKSIKKKIRIPTMNRGYFLK